VVLDRSLIASDGRQAIGRFLVQLQAHKSLGDLTSGKALFER